MSWDPDLDLEHGVLRNRLKITERAALAVAEATLTAIRIAEIESAPVRLGKGGHPFCPPEEITTRAQAVFDRADPPHLIRLDRVEIVTELAHLMASLIWLQPAVTTRHPSKALPSGPWL